MKQTLCDKCGEVVPTTFSAERLFDKIPFEKDTDAVFLIQAGRISRYAIHPESEEREPVDLCPLCWSHRVTEVVNRALQQRGVNTVFVAASR